MNDQWWPMMKQVSNRIHVKQQSWLTYSIKPGGVWYQICLYQGHLARLNRCKGALLEVHAWRQARSDNLHQQKLGIASWSSHGPVTLYIHLSSIGSGKQEPHLRPTTRPTTTTTRQQQRTRVLAGGNNAAKEERRYDYRLVGCHGARHTNNRKSKQLKAKTKVEATEGLGHIHLDKEEAMICNGDEHGRTAKDCTGYLAKCKASGNPLATDPTQLEPLKCNPTISRGKQFGDRVHEDGMRSMPDTECKVSQSWLCFLPQGMTSCLKVCKHSTWKPRKVSSAPQQPVTLSGIHVH